MNPFIPKGASNTVIVDARMDKERLAQLENLGQSIIKTTRCESVQEPISYHPDIVMHPINYNTLMVAPDVYEYYSEIFKSYDIKLIKGEKKLGYNYPDDISYNVARIGPYAIHNQKYTDEKLKFYLEREGVEFINVKQGYSKCSLGLIDENMGITSDKGIYKALRDRKIKVLLVETGYIELNGYSYGFIGGSMGNLDSSRVVFTGNLDKHRDGELIRRALTKKDKDIIELSEGNIIDVGSLISLSL